MAETYDAFAQHFDAWQRAFGAPYDDLILSRLLAALAGHPRPVLRVADLGFGTGDLVLALARAGFAVVGVDRSTAMVEVARAKVAAAALPAAPVLLHQDLCDLHLDEPVDAALSVYTVMNHLTADGDFARALTAIRAALVAGGLFVFELNLPAAYARYWRGTETVTLPDAVVVRDHHLVDGGPVLEARITITRADGTVVHDRIVQRPYADDEVETALRMAGFAVSGVERFNPFDAVASPVKALWSCVRS